MTIKEVQSKYSQITVAIDQRHIKQAFDLLSLLQKEVRDWQLISRQDELETVYKQMLYFKFNGMDDPNRNSIYNHLVTEIFELSDELYHAILTQNSSNFVYKEKAYRMLPSVTDLDTYTDDFEKYFSRVNENEVLNSETDSLVILKSEEGTQKLFEKFWLTDLISIEEKEFVERFINNKQVYFVPKSMLISALTLSLLRRFDARKFSLLVSLAQHADNEVRGRVLVGLILALNQYGRRLMFYQDLMNQFSLLTESKTFLDEAEMVLLQLIRTAETKNISKRIQEEIMPEMIKLGPKIQDKLQNDLETNDDDDVNPEWQSMLEGSGIEDKLREFGDMQMDGSDVYISTFAALKNFPFFKILSNWFLPFYPNHSSISNLFEHKSALFAAFVKNPFLCDSDKYSFCLSMNQMPQMQKDMMANAFQEESEQLDEALDDEKMLSANGESKYISNRYIQDLYRFYTLYFEHNEFSNPLTDILTFYKTPILKRLFLSRQSQLRIGEFYFSKNFYAEAFDLFKAIAESSDADATIYEKLGYCSQKLGHYDTAVDYYNKAEILQPDNEWILKHLALSFRRIGAYDRALMYYQRLNKKRPDNVKMLYQTASCYFALQQYTEALQIYFKLDYLKPDAMKTMRLLAWTAFIAGKIDVAEKYYQKILATGPDAVDYLNAGHVSWAKGDAAEARELYRSSLLLAESPAKFQEYFEADAEVLVLKSIAKEDIAMMLDSILMLDK